MNIEVIEKETLPQYKELILPYIYDELASYSDDLAESYICLAGTAENEDGILFPVSALIMLREANLDLAVLSIFTLPEHRRQGIASELLDKALFIARRLFVFERQVRQQLVVEHNKSRRDDPQGSSLFFWCISPVAK